MKRCFCPECGKQIGGSGTNEEYRISIGGLFRSTSNNYDIENALLNDDLVLKDLNDDEIRTRIKPIDDFFNMTEEVRTILHGAYGRRSTMRAMTDGFYIDTKKDPIEVDYDDIEADVEELVGNESCLKYYWVHTLVGMIGKAINTHNRVLNYLLSIDFQKAYAERDDWYNIDLIQYLTEEKQDEFTPKITSLMDGGETNVQLKGWLDQVEEIRAFLALSEACPIRLRADKVQIHMEGIYATTFSYNERNGYLRICPMCGAQIASMLGIYEQKVVSFVGMPSSGKTTLINAIYSALRDDLPGKLEGLKCRFDIGDPFYVEYRSSSERAVNKKLSALKTENDHFPSLTVTLTSTSGLGARKQSLIYTFVDVPGEYFRPANATLEEILNELDLSRMKIMRYSDMICVIMAAETLKKKRDNAVRDELQAHVDPDSLASFEAAMQKFRRTVINHNDRDQDMAQDPAEAKIPTLTLVVTKSDALKPVEKEFNGTGEDKYYGEMKKNLVDLLFAQLAECQVWDDQRGLVHMGPLLELQDLTHQFVRQLPYATAMMNRIFSQITEDNEAWERAPIFLTSPFGFYAVKDIWDIPYNDKLDALKNVYFDDLPRDRDTYLETIAGATTAGALEDDPSKADPATASEVCKAQLALGPRWTKEFILTEIGEYYAETIHHNDKPFGIKPLLYWLFVSSGLLYHIVDERNLFNNSVINENLRYLESFNRPSEIRDHLSAELMGAEQKLAGLRLQRDAVSGIVSQKKAELEKARFFNKGKLEEKLKEAQKRLLELDAEIVKQERLLQEQFYRCEILDLTDITPVRGAGAGN